MVDRSTYLEPFTNEEFKYLDDDMLKHYDNNSLDPPLVLPRDFLAMQLSPMTPNTNINMYYKWHSPTVMDPSSKMYFTKEDLQASDISSMMRYYFPLNYEPRILIPLAPGKFVSYSIYVNGGGL